LASYAVNEKPDERKLEALSLAHWAFAVTTERYVQLKQQELSRPHVVGRKRRVGESATTNACDVSSAWQAIAHCDFVNV